MIGASAVLGVRKSALSDSEKSAIRESAQADEMASLANSRGRSFRVGEIEQINRPTPSAWTRIIMVQERVSIGSMSWRDQTEFLATTERLVATCCPSLGRRQRRPLRRASSRAKRNAWADNQAKQLNWIVSRLVPRQRCGCSAEYKPCWRLTHKLRLTGAIGSGTSKPHSGWPNAPVFLSFCRPDPGP